MAKYVRSLVRRDELAATNPVDAQVERSLGRCYSEVGLTEMLVGHAAEATEAIRHSQTIREQLSASEPSNFFYALDLAASYELSGDLSESEGDLNRAGENYRTAWISPNDCRLRQVILSL